MYKLQCSGPISALIESRRAALFPFHPVGLRFVLFGPSISSDSSSGSNGGGGNECCTGERGLRASARRTERPYDRIEMHANRMAAN